MGAGTEGRGWIEGEPAATEAFERQVVRVADHLRIAMRDGVELDARLFRPEQPEGPGPCLLVADGYGAESAVGAIFDPWLFDVAGQGYAVLHASLRGSGKSGGRNDLYAHYGRDGHDLIEWMAAQPWCNGSVGMLGASLLGISQWLAAREAPPHLKAIAPQMACGDCYRELWYPGGMLPGPGRAARSGMPGVEREYASALEHRDLDAWWRERVTLAADHRAMAERGLAVLIIAGFQDYLSGASLRAYREYGDSGAPKRLIVGPWPHSAGTVFVRRLIVEFMDQQLRGASRGTAESPRVLVFVSGPDRWRGEREWPLPDEHRVRLQLVQDGQLSARAARDAAASVELRYSPDHGPFLPVMLGSAGRPTLDQTPWSEKLPSWTSAPLETPTEVTGHPQAVIRASSSAADADLVVGLSDVAPDARARLVSEGYLNLPRAADPSRPRPLIPGQVSRYEIELFPLSHVFAAGHRIRLTLAGAAVPAPEQPGPQGPAKHPHPFALELCPAAGESCSLELPVIGTIPTALAE